MHMRVGGDIDIAEIVFDFLKHLAFAVSKSFCHIRVNSKSCIANVVEMLG